MPATRYRNSSKAHERFASELVFSSRLSLTANLAARSILRNRASFFICGSVQGRELGHTGRAPSESVVHSFYLRIAFVKYPRAHCHSVCHYAQADTHTHIHELGFASDVCRSGKEFRMSPPSESLSIPCGRRTVNVGRVPEALR